MVKAFREFTFERDRLELATGDAIDVKAGIVMGIITVLGTLTAPLLSSSLLSTTAQIAQLVSLGCLAISSLFVVLTVIPREYLVSDLPSKLKIWVEQVEAYYGTSPQKDADVEREVYAGLTALAIVRIEANYAINNAKSGYLFVAFWPLLAALAIDLVILFQLGISKALS